MLGNGGLIDEPYPSVVESLNSVLKETGGSSAVQPLLLSGLHHMALLAPSGELFTWGRGAGGRLGLGDELDGFEPSPVCLPQGFDRVVNASLGGLHSAAIVERSSGGPPALLTWGHGGFCALGLGDTQSRFFPTEVLLSATPASVSCGGAHTAVVTTDGRLFTFGRDEGEGRLGVPEVSVTSKADEYIVGNSSPTAIQPFCSEDGPHVSSVACGGFHTICVDNEGAVWTWGASANGECGRGRGIGGPTPMRVALDEAVTQVAAGGFHSAALTAGGELYTWGWGTEGQLGHPDLAESGSWTPMRVEDLRGETIVHVACGSLTTFVITASGRLLSCGWNADYQLGNPERVSKLDCGVFRDVPLLHGIRCLAVAPGSAHGGALIEQ